MDNILQFYIKHDLKTNKGIVSLISKKYYNDKELIELLQKYLPIKINDNYKIIYNNEEFQYKINIKLITSVEELIQYWHLKVINFEVRAYVPINGYEVSKIKRTNTPHLGKPTPIVLRVFSGEEKIIGLYDWSHIMIER